MGKMTVGSPQPVIPKEVVLPVIEVREVIKEVPVEVIREVIKTVEVVRIVREPYEVIKEVPKEVLKIVEKEVIRTVDRIVPREVIKEVVKLVEDPNSIIKLDKEKKTSNLFKKLFFFNLGFSLILLMYVIIKGGR